MSYTINDDGTVTRKQSNGNNESNWWIFAIIAFLLVFIGFMVLQNEKNELTPSEPHYFYGSIGKYPITMKMEIKGTYVEGCYSYNNKSGKLYLSGVYDDGFIKMEETTIEGRCTGHFNGHLSGNSFSGE